jgi:hypothetical protein
MQSYSTTTRGRATGINLTTSSIVADALASGKTLDEGIQQAQEWYNKTHGIMGQVTPLSASPSPTIQEQEPAPQTVPQEQETSQEQAAEDDSADVNRRYLEAVCLFGFGSYSSLSPDQLLDVACLVQLRCPNVDEWRDRRGL